MAINWLAPNLPAEFGRCYNTSMIVGVDIGGTKTLLALFAENGKLLKEVRFETSHNYDDFLKDLETHARTLETEKAKIACVAVPGLLDRERGVVSSLGNLPWKDKYILHDASKALNIKKIYIENDSKLAGLAEARYILDQYTRVFYLTLSTGIGGALVVDGKLAKDLKDMEIGKSPLSFKGKPLAWEEFASGRAFYERYGKKAVDVDDEKTWQEFAEGVNLGLGMICSVFQAEAIVFGGGLGQRLSRFKKYIQPYLAKNLHPNVRQPKALLSTHYRGQSVIYGCYHYAKDQLA